MARKRRTRPRGTPSKTGKLRAVVERIHIDIDKNHDFETVYTIYLEILECGHIQRQPTDIFGEHTYNERRRCAKCSQGLPPETVESWANDYRARRGWDSPG